MKTHRRKLVDLRYLKRMVWLAVISLSALTTHNSITSETEERQCFTFVFRAQIESVLVALNVVLCEERQRRYAVVPRDSDTTVRV